MNKKNLLEYLLELNLRHLYNAEQQTYDFLGKMAENARSAALRNALIHHQDQTDEQIERLKQVFDILHIDIHKTQVGETEGIVEKGKEALKSLASLNLREKSKGMEGLIHEATDGYKHCADTDIHDLALASGSQKIEEFEISCYNQAIVFAHYLGHKNVESLLIASLEEEQEASDTLERISENELKQKVHTAAARA